MSKNSAATFCVEMAWKMPGKGEAGLSLHLEEQKDRGLFTAPTPHPVFEDPSHRRFWIFLSLAVLAVLFLLSWTSEFALRVYSLNPVATEAGNGSIDAAGAPNSTNGLELTDIVMKATSDTDCRQGILGTVRGDQGLAAFVPYGDRTAISGLRAHCAKFGVVYYEAFSFGTSDGRIVPLGPDSAHFPLPDFHDGWRSRNRPEAFPIIRPLEGLPDRTLAELLDPDKALPVLLDDLATLPLDGVDGGLCLDMSRHGGTSPEMLLPVLKTMRQHLSPLGLRTCLIGSADAAFWTSGDLVAQIDRAVALAFREGTGPSDPLAPQDWVADAVARVSALIPDYKLTFGLGTFATAWQSGRRTAERLSFAETMLRADLDAGEITFGSEFLNTNIRYLDNDRRLNRIWLLDAASFHNTRIEIGAERPVALWPLGYEDPAIWPLLEYVPAREAIGAPIDLSDHAIIEGAGPFSGRIDAAAAGARAIETDPQTGQITAQSYTQTPRPHRIRFFGNEDAVGELVLSFVGLGGTQEVEDLLALLEENAIEASFFLSANDFIQSAELVPDVLEAGHTIGTTVIPQGAQSEIARIWARLVNNLPQHFVAHTFGARARMVQFPSSQEQLPGDTGSLEQLQTMLGEGYLPVQSTVAAGFGSLDTETYVDRVRDAAIARPVNVLSFDFSRDNDRQTLRALPDILEALHQEGFTFTSLPRLAELGAAELWPLSRAVPQKRDDVTYGAMRIGWIGVQNLILLLAFIVALRSPFYLALAVLRRSKYRRSDSYHPPVTVVIPAFNEEMVIARTIESVLESDYPDFRIIVVDDGSTDDTAAIVENRFGSDHRIQMLRQENRGKWCALDLALHYTETPFIVIVDADSLLDPRALRILVQPFQNERIGAVAGTVEVGNRENFLTTFQVIEYMYTQQVLRRAYEAFDGIIVVPGAIGAWRVDAVRAAGQVSGDTITEDADLTVAVHRAGYSIAYQELAKSYTEVPNSVRSFLRQRLRWGFGMFQVSWKHARAILEGRTVGYISLVDAVWYGLITSLIYPIMDAILIVALVYYSYAFAIEGLVAFANFPVTGSMAFLLLTIIDLANLAASMWFARRFEWKLLAAVPLLRFGYRQLLYISSIRAILWALLGRTAHWNKLDRVGTATAGH